MGPCSPGSVLSSQLLVLCKLKPSLVVELSRELLEFVGSVSSIYSQASMFTCVVSAQHGLTLHTTDSWQALACAEHSLLWA